MRPGALKTVGPRKCLYSRGSHSISGEGVLGQKIGDLRGKLRILLPRALEGLVIPDKPVGIITNPHRNDEYRASHTKANFFSAPLFR